MAYTIKCDGYILDDIRDDELTVSDPEIELEVNTVGGGSFTIHKNHPYYGKLKKLKSVFEVSDDIGVIFRGRMTEDSADFHNSKAVDLEGAMAYFNDSTVRPFSFPEDFVENVEYITAAESGNVVAFFLKWLIDRHNEQTQPFQHFRLGNVTVSDPNNYVSRSSTDYATTWETLKSKLFDSALGGYLCARYEDDGTYIDYLSEFTLTNTQEIVFGENLLDLKSTGSATGTYSAMIPLGASIETETTDADGNTTTKKARLTIESLPDGDITDDIVKSGDTIYSKSAVEAFGWVCAPTKETTWDDVTVPENLRTRGVETLSGDLVLLTDSVEVTALDLHFTDEQIQTFRIYRNVIVRTSPHGISGTYQLPKLSLKLHSPQDTKITVGATKRSLADINSQKESDTIQRIEIVEKDIGENRSSVDYVKNQVIKQGTQILNDCQSIILSAFKEYSETGDLYKLQEYVKSELKLLEKSILINFEASKEIINDVDGDLQAMIEKLEKHFEFSADGLVIKAGAGSMELLLDNDLIRFRKNGQDFGWWDGVNFHTGNIFVDVNEIAQFGNYAFLPFDDGETDGLDLVRVGG